MNYRTAEARTRSEREHLRGRIEALIVAATLIAGRTGALAQAPVPAPGPSVALFPSLLADPKEPQFFATYLWQRSSRLGSRLGSVGFGQTFGVLGTRDWQLSIAAGVFSQFDLSSSTADLMNTDYLVGLAAGRLVAALDGRLVQDRGWQIGWSFVTGLELADPLIVPGSGWRWSLLLKGYSGPSPYGEFFRDRVSSLGFGLGLSL